MGIEKIDLLVVTETHTTNDEPIITSRRNVILAHSGISLARAGIAILAPNDGSWLCNQMHTLVPGYAILVHLTHRKSTESFWLLGVYGDISNRQMLLLQFYRTVRNSIADLVLSPALSATWTGCLVAGDWNMVTRMNDRSPPQPPLMPLPKNPWTILTHR